MELDLEKLFVTEGGFGLLLGAGASYCAGYPLMSDLTVKVISSMQPEDIDIVNSIIHEQLGFDLDINLGNPNIEVISDLLESRIIESSSSKQVTHLINITNKITESIVNIINSIREPDLQYHVALFEALKRIFSGRGCAIWIFTTNYDLVIEYAAAIAGISVLDGFQGSALRYFDATSYSWKHGTYSYTGKSNIFQPCKVPCIKLVKLHGSVNWWMNASNKTLSSGEHLQLAGDFKRTMILPRKRKVREVLDTPYDSLWRVAYDAIGTECKYLTSIGYSYGDQHINETLLLPKVRENKVCLNALLKNEPEQIKDFHSFKNFRYGTEDKGLTIWDFKEFVKFVSRISG